ncbi:GL14153, partial [Drosophila persimilis]
SRRFYVIKIEQKRRNSYVRTSTMRMQQQQQQHQRRETLLWPSVLERRGSNQISQLPAPNSRLPAPGSRLQVVLRLLLQVQLSPPRTPAAVCADKALHYLKEPHRREAEGNWGSEVSSRPVRQTGAKTN